MATASLRYAENSKRSFGMDKDEVDFAELEKICTEMIKTVLLACEAELAKHNDDVKGLPSAAMAVRESILTFLALISHQ